MPHFVVDYDPAIEGRFDRRAFARDLHTLTSDTIPGVPLETCKTRFRTVVETVVAGGPAASVLHVDVLLLPGRSAAVRTELGQAVLELLRAHTADVTEVAVHASVDVGELSDAYVKAVFPAQ